MPGPVPTRLAASLLSLLYLVVGLTGQSGHYWLETLGQSPPPEIKSGTRDHQQGHRHVTYHRHGPGGHWHFHTHTHEAESAEEPPSAEGVHDTGLKWRRGFEHHAHDCPLLSVVSHLKLSWTKPAPMFAPGNVSCPIVATQNTSRGDIWWKPLFPRGPPLPSRV